jgi:uncharacterized protein (TIGR00369 family)
VDFAALGVAWTFMRPPDFLTFALMPDMVEPAASAARLVQKSVVEQVKNRQQSQRLIAWRHACSEMLRQTRLMSDASAEKLTNDGWTIVDDDGFLSLVGPLWHRTTGEMHQYAIAAQQKHKNRRGYVQGGLLMTLADRSLGMAARAGSGATAVVTIQMDTHFIDAAKIGEILVSSPRVVRATRTLIFLNTEITADDRCVTMASGVFKIMKGEG